MAKVTYCIFFILLSDCNLINSEDLLVKILTREHVNFVGDKFLSFTVDPLLLTDKKIIGKECMSMASSLSPAYLRVAGPSTSLMGIEDEDHSTCVNSSNQTEWALMGPEDYLKFADWVMEHDFHLIFALNNDVKNQQGLWDPTTAYRTLEYYYSIAMLGKVDVIWQLGYECHNSTLEKYFSDLETLRLVLNATISEHFNGVGLHDSKIAATDVSRCISSEAGDFLNGTVAASHWVDAILFNGNATATELSKLSQQQRSSVLQQLSDSQASIWLTETRENMSEMDAAAEWLVSLGFSAKNGFDVNFRELKKEELIEPSLSFYMALLYKSLVGGRVLDVDIKGGESISAELFAHCTTLKRQVVPGAVTLFGVNMDDQADITGAKLMHLGDKSMSVSTKNLMGHHMQISCEVGIIIGTDASDISGMLVTRFTVNLSELDEGGDILQFVISQDRNGNTLINGFPMFHEGDIRPLVKRIHPNKTLFISLPPQSLGFFVLANTNIEACLDVNEIPKPESVSTTTVEEISDRMKISKNKFQRTKRANVPKRDVLEMKDLKEFVEKVELAQEIFEEFPKVSSINSHFDRIARMTLGVLEALDAEDAHNFKSKNANRNKRQIMKEQLRAAVNKMRNTNMIVANPNQKEPTNNKVRESLVKLFSTRSNALISTKKVDVNDNAAQANKEIILNSRRNTDINDIKKQAVQTQPRVKNISESTRPVQRHTSRINALAKKNLESLRALSKRISVTPKVRQLLKNSKTELKKMENALIKRARRDLNLVVTRKPMIDLNKIKHKSEQNDTVVDIPKSENVGLENEDEGNKMILKKILHKVKDLKLVPFIELSDETGDSENEIHDSENEIDHDMDWKNNEIVKEHYESEDEGIEDQIVVKTKISSDDASISFNEKSNQEGMLKKALGGLTSLLGSFKDRLSQLFNLVNQFE